MKRLVVLGGSSPFTTSLIDALTSVVDSISAHELILHGRNVDHLKLITRYAQHRLSQFGWIVNWETDPGRAVSNASVVIHQIRYGGLELRRAAEVTCNQLGCLADETLGPGALITAIRTLHPLREICDVLVAGAADAVVINLTNPLSISTSLMHHFGVRNIVGVCELPEYTGQHVADRLKVPKKEIHYEYVGLNHRGFLQNVRFGQRDLIDELVNSPRSDDCLGVSLDQIKSLHAIPTKYFPLFNTLRPAATERATFLMNLRESIAAELKEDISATPPSLKQRFTEWYPRSVVPILLALEGTTPNNMIASVIREDGLCPECLITIDKGAFAPRFAEPSNAQLAHWIQRFERHERHVLDGLRNGDFCRPSWVEEAISLDPAIHEYEDRIVNAVVNSTQRTLNE